MVVVEIMPLILLVNVFVVVEKDTEFVREIVV
jgi:hypothetical protein